MRRLVWLAAALAVACGGSARQTPRELAPIPPEQPEAKAPPAPAEPPEPAEPAGDPWAGRTDLIQPPAAARSVAVNLPRIERFTLPDGLKVLVVVSHELPIVHMHLAIPAGELDETRDKRLLAVYAAEMLKRGTNKRSADEIAAAIDLIGGELGVTADLEATHVTCSALARDLATCLTLVPEVVTAPVFPSEEMEQVAQQMLARLKQIRDEPDTLAREHFENLFWGDDHVRGWPQTAEAIAAITRGDLIGWHRAHFTPTGSLLAVAGDVDPQRLKADLTRVFADWKARPAARRKSYKEPSAKGLRIRLVDNPALNQSVILVGHLGVAHGDKDYLPAALMNYSLGGGDVSSRLLTAVRVKGGKTYSASSAFERWRSRGTFVAETATRTAETVATLKLVLGELTKMKASGPTEDELKAAKANLAGSYAGQFETAADVALAVLAAELHGLGEAWVRDFPLRVEAVTPAAAKAAAARLDPADAAVVIVGKADDIARDLDAAGLKYERAGYLEPISRREREAKRPKAAGPIDPARTEAGKKLLDAALAAKGGADKLRGLKDLKTVGKVKVTLGTQQLDGDWTRTFVVPDKLRVDLSVSGQSLAMTVTPDKVFQASGGQTHDFPDDLAAQAREGLWRDHDLILLRHLEPGTVVQAAGKVSAGGKSYDAVVIRRADGSDETQILLDPQTHFIFRLSYLEAGAGGLEEYGDYREVDGIYLPFKQKASGGPQTFDVTVTEQLVNKGVPPETFSHP